MIRFFIIIIIICFRANLSPLYIIGSWKKDQNIINYYHF